MMSCHGPDRTQFGPLDRRGQGVPFKSRTNSADLELSLFLRKTFFSIDKNVGTWEVQISGPRERKRKREREKVEIKRDRVRKLYKWH